MPIRVLVTGFSVFPGAPVNPTEELIADLSASNAFDPSEIDVSLAVLPVEYARVPELLADLAVRARPQVAIHFGLADSARGFRLERVAENACRPSPDAAGRMPAAAWIREAAPSRRSTLPLNAIRERLDEAGLPVEFSRNAGAFLCNYIFYLARSRMVAGYAPRMAGFVHVPYLDTQLATLGPLRSMALASLTRDQLLAGARLVVETSVRSFRDRLAQK